MEGNEEEAELNLCMARRGFGPDLGNVIAMSLMLCLKGK